MPIIVWMDGGNYYWCIYIYFFFLQKLENKDNLKNINNDNIYHSSDHSTYTLFMMLKEREGGAKVNLFNKFCFLRNCISHVANLLIEQIGYTEQQHAHADVAMAKILADIWSWHTEI